MAKAKKLGKKSTKTTAKKIAKKTTKKTLHAKAKSAVKAKSVKKAAAPRMPSQALPVGSQVPDFSVASTAGENFQLSGKSGKNLVLFFYPKDNTPGCTIEGHEFSKLKGDFQNLNAEVYGISRDSLKSHQGFKAKQSYTVDLLSDEDEKLCQIFDVIKEKNMYGKKVMGIERSTFLIGPDGTLKHEWRKVKPEGHAAEVLETLKSSAQ